MVYPNQNLIDFNCRFTLTEPKLFKMVTPAVDSQSQLGRVGQVTSRELLAVWRRSGGGPAAALGLHVRGEVKFWEALAASYGLRLRQVWGLRLRLYERNMMVGLHVRDSQRLRNYYQFTKWSKLSLNTRRLPAIT